MMEISDSEKTFIQQGFASNFRNDGRGNGDFREYVITKGVIPAAWGSSSCLVKGEKETEIIVSIKAKVIQPSKEVPNEGVIEYFLEST